MRDYLKLYRSRIASNGNSALSDAIQKTVDDVIPNAGVVPSCNPKNLSSKITGVL